MPLKTLLAMEPKRYAMQLADHPGENFPFELVPHRARGWRHNKRLLRLFLFMR